MGIRMKRFLLEKLLGEVYFKENHKDRIGH